MSNMYLGPKNPPKDFKNWTLEAYQADRIESEIRSVCIDALKALAAHQRGDGSERDTLEGTLEYLQGLFIALGIHHGLHKDKNACYPTVPP